MPSPWISIVLAIVSLLAGGGWLQSYLSVQREAEKENQRLVAEYLHPIQSRLTDNKAIYAELNGSYLEQPWGILESYVVKARRDGVSKHSVMRQRIDSLAEGNSKIITLMEGYTGHIIESEFQAQGDEFRRHAIRWNDRWKAVPDVIETGQQLPYAEPFPDELPQALEAEIARRESEAGREPSTRQP